MSDKTGIEWTDATWNPVTGCAKVSAGCKHCSAERDWARLSANQKTRYYGRAFADVQCHPDVLDLPMRWTKPRRIFVNSMSDLFHHDVPSDFIMAVFCTMAQATQHSFQILTKRPERMRDLLSLWARTLIFPAEPPTAILPNVWMGVSVEDQDTANERIPLLLQTPAAVRWISAEPLLGPVLLDGSDFNVEALAGWYSRVDWVVAGGESGPRARPMHTDWARSLRDQCAEAGVPFLFKQWGEWAPDAANTGAGNGLMTRVGKKLAGRLLDGVEHNGYPV